jgi:hypothetical protein
MMEKDPTQDAEKMTQRANASPRSRTTTGRGVMRGPDFQRLTIDLPKDLHKKLRLASVRQSRSMRDCVEEAVAAWLKG